MLIYWINLLMVAVWPLILHTLGFKNKGFLLFVLFVQLYLILALRAPTVGADVSGYISLFERIKRYSFLTFDISRHEPGYILLNKLLMFVNHNQYFISILAFISLSLIFLFVYKESKIFWLSIFLFISLNFYTSIFSSFRQIIAMGLIALSYHFLKKEKKFLYFLFVIIASTFHISALAFLLVYVFHKFKINKQMIIFYFLSTIVVFLMSAPITKFIINNFSSINYDVVSRGGFGYLFLLISIIIIGLVFKNDLLKQDPKANILYHILFIGVIFQVVALEFALLTRVTRYFSLFLIIFIPNVVSSIKDRKLVLFGVYLLCCLTTYFYYLELDKDLTSIVPYEFFGL